MFTLEESALLRFMLRAIGWIVVIGLVGACSVAAVHWIRTRHHRTALPHVERVAAVDFSTSIAAAARVVTAKGRPD